MSIATNLPELPTNNESKIKETLKHNLQTKHAAKFDRILSTLPDRDFIRVYLKALEFVKPKITRVENDGPKEEEKSMNILIVKSGNDDKQTIDITDYGKE